MMIKRTALVLGLLLAPAAAQAEVLDAQPNGFLVKQTVVVAAPAKRVYAALVDIGKWWNAEHSYSGKASNLSLQPRAGGCWCEKLPSGGSVEHMQVIFADPGKLLRLQGGLGPMQESGARGSLTWALEEKDGRTTVTWTYDVGGHRAGGLGGFAGPVDGVLTEAIGRLKTYVETGKPA
jgi:uncharacterized protein YndB with AHSA1/START domain